jgi:hypothetical protein
MSQSKFQFKIRPQPLQETHPVNTISIQEQSQNLSQLIDTHCASESPEKLTINKNIMIIIATDLLKEVSKDFGIKMSDLQSKYLGGFDDNQIYSQIIDLMCKINRQHCLSLLFDNGSTKHISEHKSVDETATVTATTTATTPRQEHSAQQNQPCEVDNEKCMARTAKQTQCSRRKIAGSNFCGGHEHKQPHGRIDSTTSNIKKTFVEGAKKRGRPKKDSSQIQVQTHVQTQLQTQPAVTQSQCKSPTLPQTSNQSMVQSPVSDTEDVGADEDEDQFEVIIAEGKRYLLSSNKAVYLYTTDSDGEVIIGNPVGRFDELSGHIKMF